jgi:hypothetical protein
MGFFLIKHGIIFTYILWCVDPLLGKDLETNNEVNEQRCYVTRF